MLPETGKRIGIVGSGPASLTAAYFLRTLGHDVEIHEAQEHAGGMLRYGIPAYRNPPDLLEKEIDQIRALGVRILTRSPVASVEEFRKKYDAVFLGLGTQKARLLPVEGAHLPFVLGGIDFLRAARSGEAVRVGPRVVVIGGGNVSIDVALTALRQGARHVDLTSLEKRRDMPASPDEIELAVAEGVQLHPGWGPLRFEEEGVAVFQFCERVKDETGKFDPVFDGNRLLKLEADHVILATGQGTDLSCLEGSGVENNARLRRRRPEDQDDHGAGHLRRRRRAARPADGGGGDPLGEDRRGLDRRLAARDGSRTRPPARRCGAPTSSPCRSWRTIALTCAAPRCPRGPSRRPSAKATT